MVAPKRGEPFRLLGPYRVLDLTHRDGHLAGKVLAQLGADVVKVEPPGGDPARMLAPFAGDEPGPDRSIPWLAFNAGKRGITLDIERPEGRDLFRRLAAGADFVIESFKPGYLEGLGLGYQDLKAVKPDLIVASITPFGQTGPYRDLEASDLTLMAMSAFMAMNLRFKEPPLRISVEQAFHHGAMHAVPAALAAHHRRAVSGQGAHVDVSVLEALGLMDINSVSYAHDQADPPVPYGGQARWRTIWRARDGYIVWRLFTGAVLGRGTRKIIDWAEEEGIETGLKGTDWEAIDSRDVTQERMDQWDRAFGEHFLRHTKQELVEGGLQRKMMIYAAHTMGDLLAHPHLQARDLWEDVAYPELGRTVPHLAAPWLINGRRLRDPSPAPRLGQHNREVYMGELGLPEPEMERLRGAGIV